MSLIEQVEQLRTYAMNWQGTEFGGLIERDKVLAILKAEPLAASSSPAWEPVTRFEVIQDGIGRVWGNRECSIELSYQDAGKTLKVFVKPPLPPAPKV